MLSETLAMFYCIVHTESELTYRNNQVGYALYLRVMFVLATEHALLRLFLNIRHKILFLGDLHDAAL